MINITGHIKELFEILATGIDVISVFIIIWGFLLAFKAFAMHEYYRIRKIPNLYDAEKIRQTLGVYILMGLEFMIAADIIHSFVSRSMQELYYLALIVAIRTVIAYFLGKELEHAKA